ncbi:hypothetical protein EBT31_02915 [bacterium]|nr:hypothetical protein [bacterium]NBX48633.1 hypothetical protein [bacterium]
MSRCYQIHVDTSSAVFTQTNTNNISGNPQPARVISQPVIKNNGNPFDITYFLSQGHKRLRSLTLKSIEMPIGFYNIRAPYNTITIDGITYTILEGNYTIDSLIGSINGTIGIAIGQFSVNKMLNRVTFVPTSLNSSIAATSTISVTVPLPNDSSINVPCLGYFLGFTDGQNGTEIVATNSYIINFDNYVSVWIPTLGRSSQENTKTTFKVPIMVPSGGVQFYQERTTFTQKVDVTDRSILFDRIDLQILDRFGQPMDNNGIDWSFTLEIEADT